MPKKIDPLNKKQYRAVTNMLTVTDVKTAAAFYQKALGFKKRGMMNGPDGKAMHAELVHRDSVIMLGPENPSMKGPKALGGVPSTLYLYVDNADKACARAVKAGATQVAPVMDQFWGDRAGILADPEGHVWMIATHKAEPTPADMRKAMKKMAAPASGGAAA